MHCRTATVVAQFNTIWWGESWLGEGRESKSEKGTMEPEDGSYDGILVANGYRAPLGTNWGYTMCELDENILHTLNSSDIAGLRVFQYSVI
jgi:hypothetical protein